MKPWIKAGLMFAGIIVIFSTIIIGAQLEGSTNESLGLFPFYFVSILSGAALVTIGIRIKTKKISQS